MAHCAHCTEGFLAEGTPTGTVQTIGGVDAYVAKPNGEHFVKYIECRTIVLINYVRSVYL
jgi:hypothetical protein